MDRLREQALLAENRQLRSLLAVRRQGSEIVGHAAVDALFMVQQYFMGHNTGHREMARLGMSKRRWQWAVAYLRYAGVVSTATGNWRCGLRWQAESAENAVALLKQVEGVEKWQLIAVRREV